MKKNKENNYKKLENLSRHAKVLSGISSLLEWDQETYMPPGGASIRAEQIKTMAGIVHKEKTSKKFADVLGTLIDLKTGKILEKGLQDSQKAALREWRRDYQKDTALPSSFVEEFAQLSSQAQLAWRKAKQENSFLHFAPFLDKIILMCRKKADYLKYDEHPYDALLDLYEPEAKTKEIKALFKGLKKATIDLLKKILAKKQVDDSFLFGKFDSEKQIRFGKEILKEMGFPPYNGRLDISTHPFSSACHPSDSRITTRIHPSSLMSNISAILHEGGHALYELGLPAESYGSPLCESISLGIHESQSRFWETRIGQSLPFWKHYLPLLKKTFKGPLEKTSLESFYKGINKVIPSFIRVEADEVTYSLHIILRFELEVELIQGTLSIREVPEAWNAKMQELLGIVPPTNTEGCLQDIHWSMGGFGYFPTYTLGNLYAAQLFEAFEKQNPTWKEKVAQGELLFIRDWLHQNVYQFGRMYSGKELLHRVTQKTFSEGSFIDYLNKKYKVIYS
jgi:carboxypeptidase Taq